MAKAGPVAVMDGPAKMDVERVPIDDLVLDANNARIHGPVESLAASLEEHGQMVPVVVSRATNIIKKGNRTVRAAKALGWQFINVVWAEGDERSLDRFKLRDNRIAEQSAWDLTALVDQLEAWADDGEDISSLGWDSAELERWLAPKHEDDEDLDEDEDFAGQSDGGLTDTSVKSVMLVFTPDQYEDFVRWGHALKDHWGIEEFHDAVYRAVQEAHAKELA